MQILEIPVNNTPNSSQSFTVTVDNGARNISILLKLRYLDLYRLWVADISDSVTGKALIYGVPLVTGTNILGQYEYLGIGSLYVIPAEPTKLEHPDNHTLGSTFSLVWSDAV